MAQAALPHKADTALHKGKDFAVAPPPFDEIIPEGILAFRHRRHCSHLSHCCVRALPATMLPDYNIWAVFGLSSPTEVGVAIQYKGLFIIQ